MGLMVSQYFVSEQWFVSEPVFVFGYDFLSCFGNTVCCDLTKEKLSEEKRLICLQFTDHEPHLMLPGPGEGLKICRGHHINIYTYMIYVNIYVYI